MAVGRSELDALIVRRDAVKATKDRLLGRLESAKADLASVEDECAKRGIHPDRLDATIAELNRRYEEAVTDLSTRISAAEEQIKPFIEGVK